MPARVMGQALGISESGADHRMLLTVRRAGMLDRLEFALTQNAAVRELRYP